MKSGVFLTFCWVLRERKNELSVICPSSLFFDRIQKVIHHLSRCGGGTLDCVGIYFCGGVCIAMSKVSGNSCDGNTIGNLKGCVGMPQAVNVDLGKVGGFNEITEPACQCVRMHGGSIF